VIADFRIGDRVGQLGATAVLQKTPDDEENPSKRRWLYWALFIAVAAFVVWAIAYLGGPNMSAEAPTGDDMMTVQPAGAHV
jgi:ferric-dicitrate binding protein FerR (iron transport regulator)